jgi:hypothetical protein
MANDLDQFPIDDQLIKTDGSGNISNSWSNTMTAFYQNLIGYLSQNGIFVPLLTMTQRNAIHTPQNGQMIYNTTLGSPQIFQQGVWKTFTTT